MAKHPQARSVPTTMRIGMAILITLGAIALLASVFPGDVPVDVMNRLSGPSTHHWMGTDRYGRDIAHLLFLGTPVTIGVALASLAIAGGIGTVLGVVAGMTRGPLNRTIAYVTEVLLALPALLLAVILGAALSPSTGTAILAIGLAGIPGFIRVAQTTTQQVRHQPFVEAAVLSHVSRPRIVWRHILPNVAGPLAVQATVMVGLAILAEASLSYLGLGTPPPLPSWGRMLADAQQFLPTVPIYALWPALVIGISAYGANLFGDGLRDWLDPRHD